MQIAMLVSNRHPEERFVLKTSPVLLGRNVIHEGDILLDPTDTLVSRRHAMLFYDFSEGAWYLEDTSRNGTFVNDDHVYRSRVRLSHRDRIRIGKSFDVTFALLSDTGKLEDASQMRVADSASSSPTLTSLAGTEQTPPPKGLWLSRNGTVWRDGRRLPFPLSRTEYHLLKYLFDHANELCTYDEVIEAIWGEKRPRDTLHELVFRLRRKIEPQPGVAQYLRIQPGVGLILFTQLPD